MATDTLVSVCTQGDVTQLQQLLSSNPSALEHTTQGGVTLLMHTIIGAGKIKLLLYQANLTQLYGYCVEMVFD